MELRLETKEQSHPLTKKGLFEKVVHSTAELAAGVGVAVTPGPVFALLFVVEAIEFAILVMVVGEPEAVGAVFPIVPVVIVGIVGIVNPHPCGTSVDGERSEGRGCQHEGTKKAVALSHDMSP